MISEDKDCPIVFGTSFLNVAGAYIRKKAISMKRGEEMIKFPFSTIMNKLYQRESQDEQELKVNQLVEIHLQTPEDEIERVLMKLNLYLKMKRKRNLK